MDFLKDENGNIKSWVWIGGAAIVGVILLLMTKGGSSNAGAVVNPGDVSGGQSSDWTEQIAQLNEAILTLAGNSNVPVTTGSPPSPNPTNPQYLQDIIDQLKEGNKVLEQAQQNMLSLLTQLSTQESDYTKTVNQRAGLVVAREGTSRKIADLRAAYQDKKITKASFQKQDKALRATYAQQTTQIGALNKTIDTLAASIKSLQDQITALTVSN